MKKRVPRSKQTRSAGLFGRLRLRLQTARPRALVYPEYREKDLASPKPYAAIMQDGTFAALQRAKVPGVRGKAVIGVCGKSKVLIGVEYMGKMYLYGEEPHTASR